MLPNFAPVSTATCPGCSGTVEDHRGAGVGVCDTCGGLVSVRVFPSLQAAFQAAGLRYAMGQGCAPEQLCYFDLNYLDADGNPARTHGWFDIATKLVEQWG